MEFKDTIGKEFGFYGTDCCQFKIGHYSYEVREDENDGYRSSMDDVIKVPKKKQIFFPSPIARVRVQSVDVEDSDGSFSGFHLVDVKTDHIWLKFGTNDTDSYYPYFVFDYKPRDDTPDPAALQKKGKKTMLIKIQKEIEITNPVIKIELNLESMELGIVVQHECMLCESGCRNCYEGTVEEDHVDSMSAIRKFFGDELADEVRSKIIEQFGMQ